jgi:hypothetical protein
VLVAEDGVLTESVASVPQMDREGKWVLCGGSQAIVFDEDWQPIASAPLGSDNTYRFSLSDLTGEQRVLLAAAVEDSGQDRVLLGDAKPAESLELWHRRLGHRNKRDLGHAIAKGLVHGPSKEAAVNRKSGVCEACAKAKSTRHSFARVKEDSLTKKTAMPLRPKETAVRRMDTDLKGPFSVEGPKGERHMQLFTEVDHRYRVCKTLVAKSDALSAVREYIKVDLASEGQKLLQYHSDSAPELISKDMVHMLAEEGCRVTYSPSYTPELNGVAERSNRTIWEAAYAMLLACSFPALFWVFAVVYATICTNMLPTQTINGWMSPFQSKYGAVPSVSMFHIFGCIAYVHVSEQLRDSTFAEKAYKGFFVGLKWPLLDRFLVYIPALDKVVESAHVLFDEVTKVEKSRDELLIVDPQRRALKDFTYLVHLAYRDDENGVMYVTTRVTTMRSYIVAFRAPVVGGRLGQEEPTPIHAQDVERMLRAYYETHRPQMWSNNALINVCNVLQVHPTMASGLITRKVAWSRALRSPQSRPRARQ